MNDNPMSLFQNKALFQFFSIFDINLFLG